MPGIHPRAALLGALLLSPLCVQGDIKGDMTRSPSTREPTMIRIRLTTGGQTLHAHLDDTPVARDFAALLPLDLALSDFNATEKIANLPRSLDTSHASMRYAPKAGDITYYAPWGNLAVFYKPFQASQGLGRLGEFEEPIDESIDALLSDDASSARIEIAE